MKTFFKKRICILLIFIYHNTISFAESSPLLLPLELKLDPFKWEHLTQEKNDYSVTFSDNYHSTNEKSDGTFSSGVWILKGEKLWLWNLVENSLNSYDFSMIQLEPNAPSIPLTKEKPHKYRPILIHHQGKIFFTSANYFYQFHTETKKFYRLLFDQSKTGTVLDLLGQKNFVWLLTTKGFFKFDFKRNLISDYKAYDLRYLKNHGFFLDADNFVASSKKTVSILNITDLTSAKGGHSAGKKIYQSRHEIIGIKQIDNKTLLINNPRNVVILDFLGKVIQKIPIEMGRELIQSSIDPFYHGFLFNDGLLEVFDQKERKLRRFLIPIENGNRIKKMELSWPYLIIQYSENFRVFNLVEVSEYTLEQKI